MTIYRTALLVCVTALSMLGQTSTSLVPVPKMQFVDANGKPLSGGKVYTYAAGTTTPQTTFTDATGATPNANPTILDSSGRAAIWLGPTSYKIAVQDVNSNPVYTTDQVSDLAAILKLNLASASNTTTNGATQIGYLAPGASTVPTTVAAVLSQTINITQFGALCNGVHDDGLAIQHALAYAQSIGPAGNAGAIVNAPPGNCMTSVSLDLPQNTVFQGSGTIATGIFALGGGTFKTYNSPNGGTYSYLLSIGGTITPQPVPGAKWRNINAYGNNLVQTVFFSACAQENSGVEEVYANGYTKYGIDWVGYQVQNSSLMGITCYAGTNAVASNCIHLFQANSRNLIDRVTASGDFASATQTTDGILLEAGSTGTISNVHCEGYATCVHISNSAAHVTSVAQTDGFPATMIMLLITGGSSVDSSNINKNGPNYLTQLTICDQSKPGTGTCGGMSGVTLANEIIESFYASEWNSASGGVTSVGNLLTTDKNIPNFMAAIGSYILSLPNVSLSTDAGGGTLLSQSNTYGMMYQGQGLTAGFTGGGLYWNAGCFGHDPACAVLGYSGATTDAGTWVARATTAAGILAQDGYLNFFANNGLTAGSAFSPNPPTPKLSIGPNGLRIIQTASTPTCTGNDFGTLWVNSNTTPPRFEVCMNLVWYYTTMTVGP